MIGYLSGTILEIGIDNMVLIEVQGVGYELLCTSNTVSALNLEERAQLRVYTHVREDVLQLFGFANIGERELFQSLIKVNGVGPKMAIAVMSATTTERLLAMIEEGDVSSLTKLPKVGKKKAEQIILSLKGKLILAEEQQSLNVSGAYRSRGEIVSALVHLGFKINDVEKVVDTFDVDIDMQSGVRKGLALLTTQF